MSLNWCFVIVWPQRQTFVRLLLQLQNRSLLRADVRRPPKPASLCDAGCAPPVVVLGCGFSSARVWLCKDL